MPLPELENSPEQYRQSVDVIERPSTTEIDTPGSAGIVEWSGSAQNLKGPGRLEEVAAQAGNVAGEAASTVKESVETMKESASSVYREVRSSAREGYSQIAQTAQDLAGLTAKSAKVAKQQYPLQTLAVLAGLGFVIGIGLRIWRDHEPRNS